MSTDQTVDTRVRLWCACGGAIEITRHPEHVAAVMEASWRAMHVQRGCRFVTRNEWLMLTTMQGAHT